MSEYQLSLLKIKNGEVSTSGVKTWKEETQSICSSCFHRLQNTKEIFSIAKEKIKDENTYKEFKREYKSFIKDVKESLKKEPEESEEYFEEPNYKRNRINLIQGFNNGNGNEKVNKAYEKLQDYYKNAKIALRGGYDSDEEYLLYY